MVQIGRLLYEKWSQMSKNPVFHNGEENEKVIRNPHADLDHPQKLITSGGSLLAHACQVWLTSVSAFVSYRVYSMTERSHNLRLVGGDNKSTQRAQTPPSRCIVALC